MRASRVIRSRASRLLTRLPDRARTFPGAVALTRGPLTIAGGPLNGMAICGVSATHPQAYHLLRGTLEPSVQEALRRKVRRGAVVYDVGANLGYVSLLAAVLTGPSGQVHAFEPLPENAEAIRETVAANGLENVVVHEAAVSDTGGHAEFLGVGEASWSHLADRGEHSGTRERLRVVTVALDDYPLPAPDVVKIDVEGSEIAVLRGMRRLLEEARPALIVELHETNDEVCDLLDAAGYSYENLDGPEPVRAAGPVHLLAW